MKRSIFILALGGFGIITTEFSVIGILPVIAKEFQISIDTAGWLLSGFALTIAVTGPFTVLLTSRINRKWLMAGALSLFVLSNIASALAPNFTVLMIARIVPALMHPVFWSVAIAAASRQVAPKDVPKAVAIIMGAISIGTVLGVPLTTYIADLVNWQAAFIAAGVINLIGLSALVTYIPSMPVTGKSAPQHQISALANPQLWVNLLATIIMISGMFSTYGYLAAFLSKVSLMNGKEISLMLLLFGGASVAGNWLAGVLLSKNVMLTTRLFIVALIGVHMLAYFFGGHFTPIAIIITLWGLIHTGGFLICQTRITAEAPDAPELATSLMVSFGNAGFALGSFLGGIMITRLGIQHVVWMSILLLLLTLVLSFISIKKRTAETAMLAKGAAIAV
ncbi:MFS transporter [Chitinophaga sp. 22321]|uniref:MFS transporter n=1 Tax=Chitinophaga hostae TaxID=2831022 RepID=A0ABS5J819_9BACT|nr:MFS transporter [Chitinophaga hostae]MBS0031368.1 MFS transporter [Chitinophaga hostae]